MPSIILPYATTRYRTLIWLNRLKQDNRAPVETLLEAAGAADVDLLMMGAYGHRRPREMVFGGFTRRILNDAGLPVLMAY